MKKLLFPFALLAVTALSLQATVLTISNHPNGGAQYSTLQAAYDAASAGDTLYLEATNIIYDFSTCQQIDKQLTYIGIGFNAGTQITKRSILGRVPCYGYVNMISGASGSSFYGITFNYYVGFSQNMTNILFENCRFESYINFSNNSSSGIVVRNCVFTSNSQNISMSSGSSTSTLVMTNCVLDGYVDGLSNALNTVSIDHCVFLKSQNATGVFYRLPNATITNSIITNSTTIAGTNTTGCSFVNNIVLTATTMPPASNSGTGNMTNTDPLFVNYTAGQQYSIAHDYDVMPGSPAINAGSDGTDIGVHGGTSLFSELGEVLTLPIVRSVLILNTSVAPNGSVNVQVEASRPAID